MKIRKNGKILSIMQDKISFYGYWGVWKEYPENDFLKNNLFYLKRK